MLNKCFRNNELNKLNKSEVNRKKVNKNNKYIYIDENKYYFFIIMEMMGIDPITSRMLSERSTI